MSYRRDPRDQYYNNGPGYPESYEYQQARNYNNPRMLEIRGYRPNRNPYSTQNSNTIGSPPRNRAADDDDNVSVVSSVYSQPSISGVTPSYVTPSYITPAYSTQYYQEPSSEATEQPRYNEYEYPPSPLAVSTNTHNSAAGGSSQQLIDQNEKNYLADNMEENYYNDYRDFSQNTQPQFTQPQFTQPQFTQPQFNVYDDFNNHNFQNENIQNIQNIQPQFNVYDDFNNHNFQNDETYDEEGSRHDTLTESEAYNSNPYAVKKLPSNEKGTRQSTSGEHYVVNNKERRCAVCSRKICVIITFVILVILAIGLYFVWPRVPNIQVLSPTQVGDPEITLNPAVAKMQMEIPIEFDNEDYWLPYKFNSFDVKVFDTSDFNNPIATGNKKGFSIPGRKRTTVGIPVSIDYTAPASNDPIFQKVLNACTKPPDGGQKTTLNVKVDVKLFIFGLDWIKKPSISKQISNFQCPFDVTRPSDGTDGQPAPSAPPAEQPAPAPGTPPPAGGNGGG